MDRSQPDERTLSEVLDAMGWREADAEVTPITTGITNRNYLVVFGHERFVVRVPGKDTDLLGIDRDDELEAARAAHAAGIGPEVVRSFPELGCSVTRFIEAEHIPEEHLRREDVLGLVADTLRTFHRCPPIRATFPVFRIVERYRDTAGRRGVVAPPAYEQAQVVAGRIETAFARAPMPPTPCHDDLLNANLLLADGRVWLVDFEYAGMGDPFFDLGNLTVNNDLDEPAGERLLRAYFGEVHDVHRARLALMRVMSDFREAMWGVVQQAISTLDVDYEAYAATHFRRMLSNAADDRFDAWIETASAPVPASSGGA